MRESEKVHGIMEIPHAWKSSPPKRAQPVAIRAYIYQCRDLPAADSNGTSDPFVKIWDMSE